MNLNNLNEKQLTYILKGLEALCHTDGVTMEEILEASALYHFLDQTARTILDTANNEELPETLAREPNKGERQVYGRPDYVKDTKAV